MHKTMPDGRQKNTIHTLVTSVSSFQLLFKYKHASKYNEHIHTYFFSGFMTWSRQENKKTTKINPATVINFAYIPNFQSNKKKVETMNVLDSYIK